MAMRYARRRPVRRDCRRRVRSGMRLPRALEIDPGKSAYNLVAREQFRYRRKKLTLFNFVFASDLWE